MSPTVIPGGESTAPRRRLGTGGTGFATKAKSSKAKQDSASIELFLFKYLRYRD
jgi:hypothetical protein